MIEKKSIIENSRNLPPISSKNGGICSVVNTRKIDVILAINPRIPKIMPGSMTSKQIKMIPAIANKTIMVIT